MEELLNSPYVWLLLLGTIFWKGAALWKAARNSHKKWFIILLVVNTLAILEIVYIFFFSKPKPKEELRKE